MFKIIVLVISLFGLQLQSVEGRIIQNGQCDPNIELATDFNIANLQGTWYEFATTDLDSGDCSSFEFNNTEPAITVSRYGVTENFEAALNGVLNATDPPRLVINWENSVTPVDFWILDMVENFNFHLVYNCINISPVQRSISILLLQRTTEPLGLLAQSYINTQLNSRLGITLNDLRNVQHTEAACTVLPVIQPGNPIVLPGQCDPNISVVQNFDVVAFTGLWHELASYVSENSVNQCSRARYTLNGNVVDVVNSQVINQALDTITGTATVISDDNSAKLEVILNIADNVTVTQELFVLATDYTNFAISYSCINIDANNKRVFSWILSRTRQLTESAQAAVNEAISSQVVLNNQYYQQTQQTDESCFFYPEPVPNQPVIFGGFCDTSIPVVTNFSAVAYMGTWHDIESYPSIFQTGTCRNANYVLTDVVNVRNTQVLNQTLDTTIGFAVAATDDLSGKLDVTFPIAGTDATITSNYWVLATDYTSYALVYSCVNLEQSQDRQVWAWKISRTKQLTQTATNEINAVIANIPALDQRYFEPVDQSVEGCFYFPEPEPGVPVVFPGQCDDNIPVVENFNLNSFEGLWYEIEAYPKLQQQGQCINHVFSGSGTIESSQIIDQFLNVSNGVLTSTNTDNPAKLTITLPNIGVDIPFWILQVDYTDFALAYSCVNLDADFRAVYSWKLSRTKQLSQTAFTAINNFIDDVDVLNEIYYEPIDQTDEACFFLPELAPGEPVVIVGQCDPNISVVPNFDAARYLGRWRLIESYPSDFQNGSCNQATYTLNQDSTVDVFNTQVNNETLVTINGVATIVGNGKLEVVFPNAPPIEYWVLDTDYDSYSLVYSCSNINTEQRRIWSWKMSRTTSLTQEAIVAIDEKINTVNVLNNRFYEQIDHSDEGCFYFPDPVPNTAVRFRGRCDQSIPTVSNFDASKYLGLWHNIELYPSTFQAGTCSNALYSAGEDGVMVFNTQVVNQTLDTMTGLAVVAFDDGRAILNVTFPVAGTDFTVTTNYWILDTDYDSYSIVYTCEEVDDEYDEYILVYSWKLSRTKQLTPNAITAINSITSNIKVLDDRYYFDSNQSPEGCFYFPEPQPGVPVVFPGECDTNIGVVQNFDLSRFEGIWHEVEAYPKVQQQGQCINHEYTTGTLDTLNLQSSHVLDASLSTSSGVLSFVSNDNSARMSITINNVNGTVITMPFWILATDYEDYALAYSCIDEENDYRGVFSWKLSRTKQLSENALTPINSAIDSVKVLDQRYYEPINQSDDVCFYFPDIAPGDPIILAGQCESDIAVVENFDASRYLGRWRLIESYPSDFQNGSCNQATYTLNQDSTVDVFNTQVNNETLVTINGVATIVGNGKLEVVFPNAPPIEYWVLDTDYDSYSLVYSCSNINTEQRRIWSWKMSRTTSLTPEANVAIDEKINTVNVLNNRFYEQIDHSDEGCFYFPDPVPNTAVRFRGRCDQSIPTVSNFDASKYLGLWHNIELYPSTFQAGTCSNALYSAGEDGVMVFNTQVVNQTLDTMTGLAVVAFDDGRAILNVTFPVAGTDFTVTTNYWILDTDYDSYSIVYTCEEVDDEYDEYILVYSWKLSRTKQLTPNAITAINSITSNIKVLDDRYYFDSNQSPEGCFYFPEPQPGVPVVFPGECDTNIDVVQNFDLSRFEGIWHEVEAYPKVQQQGQCINHEYTTGTLDTLNLQSSHVLDASLSTSSGVLSFVSNDNSARMSITINNVNGTVITMPFWILETDYEDYALAYSCIDEENDYRGVFSWKLSRNKNLSNAANININNFISEVKVLDQRYYETIDQSDEACFYFPDVNPGQPVIFPGQCDETIPTQPDFEPARYLGRWRTIATYESDFQGGSCGQATYTLAENEQTVIVYNTQVLTEQTFDEIYGTAEIVDNGKLLVNFTTAPELANYWVLATDYDSYALVYSCRNIDNDRRQVWSWKLSRDRVLSDAANIAINAVINNINVLNEQYYIEIGQTEEDCFYYPEADGQPVRFRGQCNDSVPVVNEFDANKYAGVWYDIESYPQGFQFGTCPTATYTVNGDVVDVYNTQVVNQQLDVINAVAVPANNDGSAKLNVTFPIAGTDLFVTTPYWVLDTDYDNYSLVYSCENIDEEYYRVTSWKLSRSQEISNTSSDTISQTMENIKELRQQYYDLKGHSETDCFFYPNNNGGPVILDGQCESDSDINVVSNFNKEQFSGSWYEIALFPTGLAEAQCVYNEYNFNEEQYAVRMTAVIDERLITFTGPVVLEDSNRGIFNLNLTDENGTILAGKMYVLDTDYTDYALMYSCRPIGETQKQVYSWKLSRSQGGLSASATENINTIVSDRIDLFENYYKPTGQDSSACFYYPVFDSTPSSIILPGSCDAGILGMPNFNAEAYLGRWYEIERYPQPDQFGDCSQATYSSGINAVDVVNTQVVNRTLLTQVGTAVLGSTDNTGQLTVTFEVGGETRIASYYILATDYTSYSLVYNCRNLADNRREVFSWKLSREKTLSNQASAAIANVVDSTQGLLQDYYLSTSQSDESCFYVPEFNPNQAVHFRGRCEQINSGITNFNSQMYFNQWWHEIERYPSDTAGGDCVSTRYEASGNQISFTDTKVFNNDGSIETGTVTGQANGQILKTYNDGRTEQLWVLATDYNSYSLLLSCENVDDEYMRVWSAKHSRTRTLTQEAQNALEPIINNNDLLYEEFYLTVSQSDNSCFYYPEPNGQQVILPGQCDSAIPTQQNFDIDSYIGTWYQTERYPYPEIAADSVCIGTRYTLNEAAGTVEVVNWENVDGEVKSIEGVATLTEDTAIITVVLYPDPEDEDVTTTTNLYVLSTDYTSYSLAYTCTNVDEYHRVVVALKLSRTREMPDSATAAINNYMSNRNELDQRYFIQVEQNEDCVDPNSSFVYKSSIVITIVCLLINAVM